MTLGRTSFGSSEAGAGNVFDQSCASPVAQCSTSKRGGFMNRPSKVARVAAIASASVLVLAACGGGGDDGAPKAESGPNMPIYFVDGNTADYSKAFDAGVLEGVKATFPGAELGDDFKKRLSEVDTCLLYTSDAADDLLCVDLG